MTLKIIRFDCSERDKMQPLNEKYTQLHQMLSCSSFYHISTKVSFHVTAHPKHFSDIKVPGTRSIQLRNLFHTFSKALFYCMSNSRLQIFPLLIALLLSDLQTVNFSITS